MAKYTTINENVVGIDVMTLCVHHAQDCDICKLDIDLRMKLMLLGVDR